MSDTDYRRKILNKKTIFRYLIPLVTIGLAVNLLLPSIADLENTARVLRSMSVWIICIAIAAQVCSYIGSGYLLKVILDLGKSSFSIFRGILITLAAASIGLLIGGWVSATATTYYWVSKSENVSEEAALAGFLPGLYNNVVLTIISFSGLLYLILIHDISRLETIAYSAVLSVFGSVIAVIMYGIWHREKLEKALNSILKLFQKFRIFSDASQRMSRFLDNAYVGAALLQKQDWKKPIVGSFMNTGFDMLSLYFIFVAAGKPVSLIVLVAGYSVAFILKLVVFFIPGGIGAVESAMVLTFTSLGVPSDVSVVSVLIYRLFSFWIPSILGFAASLYLRRITH